MLKKYSIILLLPLLIFSCGGGNAEIKTKIEELLKSKSAVDVLLPEDITYYKSQMKKCGDDMFCLNDLHNEIKEIVVGRVESGERERENEALPDWDYSQETDEMTDKVTYYATATSENSVNFDFPYDGGSELTLGVRNDNGKNDVYIQISKGQFNSTFSAPTISVRFDDEKVKTYSVSESTTGESDLLFITNSKDFIAKLKSAKKFLIEPEFFQSGTSVFNFDSEDFKWEH